MKIAYLASEEAHIITGCLTGDRKSQEWLYQQHYPVMIRICQRFTNDLDEAGGLYNEAMMKVFKKIDQFNHDGSFEGWVKRIVINTCIDYSRRVAHITYQPVHEMYHEPAPVLPEVYARLAAADIMQLVRELPKNTALVFNLHILEGYKHQEIATMLGISEGTSKWHLNEARKILKIKIDQLLNQQLYLHAI
jgi:RNA polymerase sigma-70 factor, ECF subfamily